MPLLDPLQFLSGVSRSTVPQWPVNRILAEAGWQGSMFRVPQRVQSLHIPEATFVTTFPSFPRRCLRHVILPIRHRYQNPGFRSKPHRSGRQPPVAILSRPQGLRPTTRRDMALSPGRKPVPWISRLPHHCLLILSFPFLLQPKVDAVPCS